MMHSGALVIIVSWILYLAERAESWVTETSFRYCKRPLAFEFYQHTQLIRCYPKKSSWTLLASATNDYKLDEGPEKSRMYEFISDFLRRSKDGDSCQDDASKAVDTDRYTHLIAIPVETCHELLLELESVQRAILYHCPILVHACVTPAVTRLPLLHVQVPQHSLTTATDILHRIVHETVRKLVYVVEKNGSNNDMHEKSEETSRLNSDGIRPVMLTFEGLEIDDGQNTNSPNEVLSAVATADCAGTFTLQKIIVELQDRIKNELGWDTMLPLDPQNVNVNEDNTVPPSVFRPRIPFMRLPEDWESKHLTEQVKTKKAESQGDKDDSFSMNSIDPDDIYLLTSDEGGNGISPIFWGKWMDDTFGIDIRMREISIYRRSPGVSGLTEKAFYFPESKTVPLPVGNDTTSQAESKFESYNNQRLREAEDAFREEKDSGISRDRRFDRFSDDDLMVKKTVSKLEALYSKSEEKTDLQILETEFIPSQDTGSVSNKITEELIVPDPRPSEPDVLDDWMKQRIQKAVQSRARVKSQLELATKKDKPPVEENVIFSKYKDGTLVHNKESASEIRELPPFPSREHCIGFWRVIGSPTGFLVEEGDASRSDNLILRVDGTVAGGPILDQETRQKASGGTWKLIIDDNDLEDSKASIRIRLVIPPKKERILVMEGKLEKVSMSVDLPLTKSTFGIPFLEEKVNASLAKSKSELEDIIYCSGPVWIEDATTSERVRVSEEAKKRDVIGNFSFMKLPTPTDPRQFTITIPRPVRNQD